VRKTSHLIVLITATILLEACAETFQEKVVRRNSGISETLVISAEYCGDPDLELPAGRLDAGDLTRVRQVRDVRSNPELLGLMLDHWRPKPLYQLDERPLDRALAEAVERMLSRIQSTLRLTADLALIEVWVDSFSPSKFTDLKVPVIARFEFATELYIGEGTASVLRSTFAGEARRTVWQANTRNHESTLNEAFCAALSDFRNWAKASMQVSP
jgi:hypothetical protein